MTEAIRPEWAIEVSLGNSQLDVKKCCHSKAGFLSLFPTFHIPTTNVRIPLTPYPILTICTLYSPCNPFPHFLMSRNLVLDTYQIGDCIGKGAYGSVFRALNTKNGDFVAIKQISIDGEEKAEALESAKKEIEMLKSLNHPNIIKYHNYELSSNHLNIILELCEGGSLQNIISKFGKLPEKLVGIFISQVLNGLSYLHSKNIIHRDIKAANLLCTKSGHVKLSDFGTSRLHNGKLTIAGSPYWVAPEIITMNGATQASDIWSLGCTIVQLVTGEAPYQNMPIPAALYHIVNNPHPPLSDTLSPNLKLFLMSCFIKNPTNRPTANTLLSHPWILDCISSDSFNRVLPTQETDNPLVDPSFYTPESQSYDSSYYKTDSNKNGKYISTFTESADDDWESDFQDLHKLNINKETAKVNSDDIKNNKYLLLIQSQIGLQKLAKSHISKNTSKSSSDTQSRHSKENDHPTSKKHQYNYSDYFNFDSLSKTSNRNKFGALHTSLFESNTLNFENAPTTSTNPNSNHHSSESLGKHRTNFEANVNMNMNSIDKKQKKIFKEIQTDIFFSSLSTLKSSEAHPSEIKTSYTKSIHYSKDEQFLPKPTVQKIISALPKIQGESLKLVLSGLQKINELPESLNLRKE
ncbi:hypothetical protein BB558_001785 [Smittium angustum]|uniref:non-specific serine/threonine protein kinase n=1 Tax=Smittium angustum TaxID=133377 RepID=A0A2U1JAE7_SMIAN|nr:hypothetical protein BB558_001785 [Smittium angustum]